MESKKPPAIEAGHSHPEAFCHMQYFGQRKDGTNVSVSIWNSRDGVTPFGLMHDGADLQHVNWGEDRFDPGHKPKKGDLIWMSYDEKSAKACMESAFDKRVVEYGEIKGYTDAQLVERYNEDFVKYNYRAMLGEMVTHKEQFITAGMADLLTDHGEPKPRLVVVEEDWV